MERLPPVFIGCDEPGPAPLSATPARVEAPILPPRPEISEFDLTVAAEKAPVRPACSTTCCIREACSWNAGGPAGGVFRVKKRPFGLGWTLEMPVLDPARPGCRLSCVGTTGTLAVITWASRSCAASMPNRRPLWMPLPNSALDTEVTPARTWALVKIKLALENTGCRPRIPSGPIKRPLKLFTLMMLILVMFTTCTRLKPNPHQGKNGSNGPTGHQPMLPKPKPTCGPNPKKNTKAGDHTGR